MSGKVLIFSVDEKEEEEDSGNSAVVVVCSGSEEDVSVSTEVVTKKNVYTRVI